MNRLQLALLAVLVSFVSVAAQSPASGRLSFEAATVKLNRNPPSGTGQSAVSLRASLSHGRLTFERLTLGQLISQAYNGNASRVEKCPSWCAEDRFDVIGKAESPDATPQQVEIMLQTLLAEQFKLVVRREKREIQGYALIVGKNGAKLQAAKDDEKLALSRDANKAKFTHMPISGLESYLTGLARQPVVEMTGLGGPNNFYDFTIDLTTLNADAAATAAASGAAGDEPGGVFVRTSKAIEEQLGLKLEPRKVSVEYLVVDKAERLAP